MKVVSVSAVRLGNSPVGEAEGPRLAGHSYRAGLWDAKTFANPYWAESCRRELEKAKQIVCISDGAVWIWTIVFICFAQRTEILDWWHVVQYLRQIVGEAYDRSSGAAVTWMEAQKASLAQSQHRLLFRRIRLLYPHGTPLPEAVQ